jgi:hypothetical protein
MELIQCILVMAINRTVTCFLLSEGVGSTYNGTAGFFYLYLFDAVFVKPFYFVQVYNDCLYGRVVSLSNPEVPINE